MCCFQEQGCLYGGKWGGGGGVDPVFVPGEPKVMGMARVGLTNMSKPKFDSWCPNCLTQLQTIAGKIGTFF